MIRRLLILALLLTACMAWARPFSTGSKWGTSIGPGFAPGSIAPRDIYAEDIPGCVLALYPENYSFNSGATATWADVSGYGNDLFQSVEAKKPEVETYSSIPTVRTGPTTERYLLRNISGIFDGASLTVVLAFANRKENSGATDNVVACAGRANTSDKISGFTFNFRNDYNALNLDGGWGRNLVFNAANLMLKDGPISIVGFSASGTARTAISDPAGTFTWTPFPTQLSSTGFEVALGTYGMSPGFYYLDANIFSYHIWNRALSDIELAEAMVRVKAAVDRGHR